MEVSKDKRRIPLSAAAREASLTSQGLLKILRRTGNAIRDDGRWYADPQMIDQITNARRILGTDRNTSHRNTA